MPPRLLAWSGCARFLFAQLAYRARAPERLWRDVEGEPFQTTLALLGAGVATVGPTTGAASSPAGAKVKPATTTKAQRRHFITSDPP